MMPFVKKLGLQAVNPGTWAKTGALSSRSKENIKSISPVDGKLIAEVSPTLESDYEKVMADAPEAFLEWRTVPAPKRGLLVRALADEFRVHLEPLGELVSYEMGKIKAEGIGEVQEAIDMADFAVGLSRQLYGKNMHSERPHHRMYEQWHPLGLVGVITAFNFPMAVWAWNAMLASICGDVVVWKPSEHTPLVAVAVQKICNEVTAALKFPNVFYLVNGTGADLGKRMAADPRFALISATGSCRMGRSVGEVVGGRLGKCLLELGGNNAVTVLDDADLELVVPSIVFGAVGTSGQRCTSIRRVFVTSEIKDELVRRLVNAYTQVKIGNPLEQGTLMGPLVNEQAVKMYKDAIDKISVSDKAEIICGGNLIDGLGSNLYVEPTIVLAQKDFELLEEETFAPIVYIVDVSGLGDAIVQNNSVAQGLSSSLFTSSLQSGERFLSASGSDCGIANVNIGTSGAEIGGAFGGEKDTGGGREAGSDAWKQYMRRQTNTINFGNDLPLAQGIKFDL